MAPEKITYASAGVDIDKANRLVDDIRQLAQSTHDERVIGGIGGFGGCFALDTAGMQEPVLVASTDGVGTKLKVAFLAGQHRTVGIDLVAMCANDLAVMGARPLFFLDYYACGALDADIARDVLAGIAEGCRQASMALIGGETAELPGMYKTDEYDLAGFAVGIVDRQAIIDGQAVRPGMRVLGLPSVGLHSNGYSLARRVFFEHLQLGLDARLEGLSGTLGDELLRPTRIYIPTIRAILETIRPAAISHITGGGLPDNIGRLLPADCAVRLSRPAWPLPPIFAALARMGEIEQPEMDRTFNMGLGLVLVLAPEDVEPVRALLAARGEMVYEVGEVIERGLGQPAVEIVE